MIKLIFVIIIVTFMLAMLTWLGLDNGHRMTKQEIKEYQRMIEDE